MKQLDRHEIRQAMRCVVEAHRSIDLAESYLRGTRLEPQWQALWSSLDALQAELLKEKVRMGVDIPRASNADARLKSELGIE